MTEKIPETQIDIFQIRQLYQTLLLLNKVDGETAARYARLMNPRTFSLEDLTQMVNDAVIRIENKGEIPEYDREIMEYLESLGNEGIIIFSVMSDLVVGLNALIRNAEFRLSDFVHPDPKAKSKISYLGFYSIWKEIGLNNEGSDSLLQQTHEIIHGAKANSPSFLKSTLTLDNLVIRDSEKINGIGGWPVIYPTVQAVRKKIYKRYFAL